MGKVEIEPWEPEETVGKLWHAFASRLDAPEAYHESAVDLSQIGGRLAVFFRGLGGDHSVEIRPARAERSHHRLRLLRRLGADAETLPRASFDGEILRLPEQLAIFPAREANAALYLWLTASIAHVGALAAERGARPWWAGKQGAGLIDDPDPLRRDLAALAAAQAMVGATLDDAPGLRPLYRDLCQALLSLRQTAQLPRSEAAVEAVLRHFLGDKAPLPPLAARMKECVLSSAADFPHPQLSAPRRYRPFAPVALWPDLRPLSFSAPDTVENRDTDGTPEEATDGIHRARRRKSDQAERNDSLILHKFESILSWAEFLNLNRRVDDDDPDNAKKAADDQDEIGLGQISKAPATRLKLHLDLAPEDVDRERLSGKVTYPEWDTRTGAYMADHVCVLTSRADAGDDIPSFRADAASARRIRHVRRQFEALRPRRIFTPGHLDGDELDMDAAVRAQVDLLTTGVGNERIWRQSRPQARDLAVMILLDVSRSTESAVGGRAVIDVEREALAALAWGLDASGDDCAINAFSSLKRHRVYVQNCKRFDERMGEAVESRIGALRPGFYTRLGAAIRHSSAELDRAARKRKLLLVITDGKPNDLDHYEGRHGIEDTMMAVREARRAGQAVFGVTVDRDAKSWFARMFGPGGFAVIPDPEKLTHALPRIYRQLVSG